MSDRIGIRFDSQQKVMLQQKADEAGLPLARMLYNLVVKRYRLPPKQDGRVGRRGVGPKQAEASSNK